MSDDITYNQIIFLTIDFFTCQTIKKLFTEKGKLILILEDSKKVIIAGNSIDASGHRNRIREIVSIAEGKGFNIHEKSVKHYASGKDEEPEYILDEVGTFGVKWKRNPRWGKYKIINIHATY